MAKFNTGRTAPAPVALIIGERRPSGRTYQGGGYARNVIGELFLLAVSNMVGEDTFYEAAADRDDRYRTLVRAATLESPEWTVWFLRWLRQDANLRSASLVGAAEFVRARLDAGEAGLSRQVVDSVLQRADELVRWDAAAVFGLALARRCANADVVSFSAANTWQGRTFPASLVFEVRAGESLLAALRRWDEDGYFIGGGTDTAGAVRGHFAGQDRVVILTDEQAARQRGRRSAGRCSAVHLEPGRLPVRPRAPSGVRNRYAFGGLTDTGFRLIPLLEADRDAHWPFWPDCRDRPRLG